MQKEKRNKITTLTSPLAGSCGRQKGEGDKKKNILLNPLIGFECVRTQNHFPRQGGSHTTNGFTLIELLVVVLIIGILAAVALPQYQKAVWKSRTMQLLSLSKSLAGAQQRYKLAAGTNALTFSELDLGFDNLTAANASTLGAQAPAGGDVVRYNDQFELVLNYVTANGNLAIFRTGKYKGNGFYTNLNGKTYCMEWYSYYKETAGSFCQKILGAPTLSFVEGNVRYYAMP